MSNIWEKFDNEIDVEGLKEDIAAAAEGNSDFKEVPFGDYEVEVEKLELTESKKGSPMLSCWLKILTGDFQNSMLFYNQVLNNGYGIHFANEFLKSLDTDLPVKFENFKQYNALLETIKAKISLSSLEYLVEYGENDKGYSTYKIAEVYEAE